MRTLEKTYYVQDHARNTGFDWKDKRDVWDKVKEELEEVVAEVDRNDQDKIEEEFGDLLFSLINAARLYDVNPEKALERCNQKFIRRFSHIEAQAERMGKQLQDMTLEEMDEFWKEAKAIEKGLK